MGEGHGNRSAWGLCADWYLKDPDQVGRLCRAPEPTKSRVAMDRSTWESVKTKEAVGLLSNQPLLPSKSRPNPTFRYPRRTRMRRMAVLAELLAVAAAYATSVACAAQSPRAPPDPAALEFEREVSPHVGPPFAAWIVLKTTMCYGTCPVFELAVFPDGRVIYYGELYVMRRGLQKASLASATVDQLRRAIDDSHVATLNPKCCDCTTVTDAPATFLTIADDGRLTSITHYHGCSLAPGSLRVLEDVIIEITGAIKWVGTEAERLRTAKEQHWRMGY